MSRGPTGLIVELRGVVSSGLGRAHRFMAQTHYQEQFKPILSSTAWPGTLNVKVEAEELSKYRKLRRICGLDGGLHSGRDPDEIADSDSSNNSEAQVEFEDKAQRIHGFERDGTSFGGATAFSATISAEWDVESEPCAILIPDLTRHTDVVEIIAVAFLREAMDLHDGDEVTVTLSTD
jgi:riboflavin kinase